MGAAILSFGVRPDKTGCGPGMQLDHFPRRILLEQRTRSYSSMHGVKPPCRGVAELRQVNCVMIRLARPSFF